MSCLDDICAIILDIEIPASYYLEHLLFVPVVILIIVTIVIKDNDDVKWLHKIKPSNINDGFIRLFL
uniref:Uncharacterized protein n=1 Tax=Acrobeloides nanus TaxID=290746 RepID=A0A914E379_9BILA